MNYHTASHRTMHILLALCLISIPLGLMLFFPPPPRVHAAAITVNTLSDADADDGFCSLREAILNANNNNTAGSTDCTVGDPGLDTITFSVTGTIVLSTSLPAISDTLAINGPGAGLLTISGNNAVRVIFMGSGKTLNLSNVRIANGFAVASVGGGIYSAGALNITSTTFYSNSATTGGGGIYNAGTLNITGTTFYSNNASSQGGGGIYNDATVTIINSTFLTNTAGGFGGGIRNNGTLTVTSTTLSGNSAGAGGGISNDDGTSVISSTTFSGNNSQYGGAIHNIGTLNIANSTFSSNSGTSYGGGILSYLGILNITDSTFSGNSAAFDGGGIQNGFTITGSTMTLTNSTFSGNTATNGGGFENNVFSTTTITNSTFYSNSVTGSGGGIGTYGRLTMTNSTLSNNSATNLGGGIFRSNDTATLRNTIVANNNAGTAGANCSGTIGDGGNNLQWNPNSDCGFALAAGDPKLAPLANNGGPTKTIALFVGSAAIDAGDNATCPSTDQRGVSRLHNMSDPCDIGAFEGTEYPLYLPLILK